jgi:Ca-activated chloride channel family protein
MLDNRCSSSGGARGICVLPANHSVATHIIHAPSTAAVNVGKSAGVSGPNLEPATCDLQPATVVVRPFRTAWRQTSALFQLGWKYYAKPNKLYPGPMMRRLSMQKFRVDFVISIFLLAIGAVLPLPAQEGFNIKVDVSLVTTDVTVVGRVGAKLQPEDFVVYDNDVAQSISYFSSDQIPLAVAIVIDRSLTVQKYMSMLQIAAVSSLRRLKPEDQVALFVFDYNVVKLNDLTEDRAQIAEKIGKIKNRIGTNIYDAVYEAAKYLKKNAPSRRRAIILISDNIKMGPSGHNPKKTREELLETATTLYNIKTPADFGPPMFWPENRKNFNESNPEVRMMAQETGGEVLDMQSGMSIRAALERIISNLRLQYTIGFNPSDPGEKGVFRRLAVKFASADRCPGCQVRTRSGYYPGVSAQVPPPNTAKKKQEPVVRMSEQDLIQESIGIAAGADMNFADIRFIATTAQQQGPDGQPQVRVDLQVDLRSVKFKPVGDLQGCRLDVVVFYADSKGKVLGSEKRILKGQLNQETYREALQSGAAFSIAVPLKTPDQRLKIVVYDEESDKLGTKVIKLP